MPDRRRGSVEDLFGYTRLSRHHDHNRLWRLSIVFFVAVAIFGVAYMEDFVDKELAMSGPFYAALVAIALAADRLPIEPLARLPVADAQQRVIMAQADGFTAAMLGLLSGVAALYAAASWLDSVSSDLPLPYGLAAVTIALVGSAVLLRGLVSTIQSSRR